MLAFFTCRCIGTLINNKDILCSVGIMVEQLYLQMVTSLRAVYMVLVEVVMFLLRSSGESLSQNIVMAFPTDQFYSLVCSCKDVFAASVGLLIAIAESVLGLMTTGRIDLTLQTFVSPRDSIAAVQIRSLGSLLFNIIADTTLYPLLALHRWILCIMNAGLLLPPLPMMISFSD